MTTHEVGTASATQVHCTHEVSLLLGADVSEAHSKRVDREGGVALRTNPSGTRPATVRIRLGSPPPRRTTKNDSMNVGRVALLDVRTKDLTQSDQPKSPTHSTQLSATRATVSNREASGEGVQRLRRLFCDIVVGKHFSLVCGSERLG